MRLVPVQVNEAPAVFPDIEWHLKSFAERSNGTATAEDFKDSILGSKHQLWVVMDAGITAVVLTEVASDRKQTVRITHCAGQGRVEWQEMAINTIEQWAKERGSMAVMIICRFGWKKSLEKMGFKATHIVLERT